MIRELLLSIYNSMIKPLTLSFILNLVSAGLKYGDDDLGFYHLVSRADDLCVGVDGPTPSIAGWIGLEGDSDAKPKRSFFWYVRIACT